MPQSGSWSAWAFLWFSFWIVKGSFSPFIGPGGSVVFSDSTWSKIGQKLLFHYAFLYLFVVFGSWVVGV